MCASVKLNVVSLEMSGSPAIDVKYLARDVRGVIEQETHGSRNILRAAGMFQQRMFHDARPRVAIE